MVFFMKDVYTKDDVTKFKELVEAGCYEFAFIWFVIHKSRSWVGYIMFRRITQILSCIQVIIQKQIAHGLKELHELLLPENGADFQRCFDKFVADKAMTPPKMQQDTNCETL